ncbi:hypothetical protein CL634_10830 [bacterium]|nr:hypothetical protein [bacterium]
MSILNKLTEGIVDRDLQKEGAALRAKWERTGLLEGLEGENARDGMARLLENQAKELLREAASSMAGGDVEGFASVAFPIVRRVFGGLIANDLVSVQPMSLPSGLIFFLDFTFGGTNSMPDENRLGNVDASSLFGGGAVGHQLTGGVSLGGVSAEQSFYALNQGYSSPTGSHLTASVKDEGITTGQGSNKAVVSGTFGGGTLLVENARDASWTQADFDKLCRFDPDLISGTSTVAMGIVTYSGSSAALGPYTFDPLADLNTDNLIGVTLESLTNSVQLRRLTQWSGALGSKGWSPGDPKNNIFVFNASIDGSMSAEAVEAELSQDDGVKISWPRRDNFDNVGDNVGRGLGAVVGAAAWGLEGEADIPEINIKVDSVSVTAQTKKLKAKWTPELGQDLNAYHNLDAEVELTSILSEQIALEIDREILNDLVVGATAGTYYWARSPGMFVNRTTGKELGAMSATPDFTGNVSEWYETLVETINDVSAQIHRKTLRGGANCIVVSPEVANILEFTSGFRANITGDENKGVVGAVKTGSLSKKWDVFVDPYFPRNVVLVARRGNSFLESGYVYAPYVPLQVTPTIFGIEDFVPRKGVLTRYAKKMVRPDMYGLVIVRGLLGESGATS